MKMKCLACHEFRLAKRQCRVFCAKLHLLDVGRIMEALELEEGLASVARMAGARRLDSTTATNNSNNNKHEMVVASALAIDAYLDSMLALGPPPPHSHTSVASTVASSSSSSSPHDDVLDDNTNAIAGGTNHLLTFHERAARRFVLKEFQSACTKALKCANCSAFSPKVRHDQYNKIFMMPLAARNKRANFAERVVGVFRLGVNIVVRLAQAMPHLVEILSIVEYHDVLLSPHCLVNSLVCLKPFAYASIHPCSAIGINYRPQPSIIVWHQKIIIATSSQQSASTPNQIHQHTSPISMLWGGIVHIVHIALARRWLLHGRALSLSHPLSLGLWLVVTWPRTSFSKQALVLKRVHSPHDDEYCIDLFVFVTGGGAAAGCGIHGDNGVVTVGDRWSVR